MKMKAEEKAKELVQNFIYELTDISNAREKFNVAKACAIICVEEILSLRENESHQGEALFVTGKDYLYWKEVKTHLQNL